MAESKYDYTDVSVWIDNYNQETKTYLWKVQTKSFWEIEFKLRKLDQVKVTQNGNKIVAEIQLNDGDQIWIFENVRDGSKSFGGTAVKGEFFINIKPLLTAGPVKNYKVTFVEMKGLTPTQMLKESVDDTF